MGAHNFGAERQKGVRYDPHYHRHYPLSQAA